jgi:phosphate transport system substrate-binding protein
VLIGVLTAAVRAEDLAIVVAPNVPLSNLTLPEALRIFQCQTTRLSDGMALNVVTRERGCAERNALLAGIYNFNDAAYEKFFMQAVFTGVLQAPPRIVSTASAMKKLTISKPGTIGYIRASEVDSSVKVVKIDGVGPGEPGYRVKLAAN